jgi:hypothetical protein
MSATVTPRSVAPPMPSESTDAISGIGPWPGAAGRMPGTGGSFSSSLSAKSITVMVAPVSRMKRYGPLPFTRTSTTGRPPSSSIGSVIPAAGISIATGGGGMRGGPPPCWACATLAHAVASARDRVSGARARGIGSVLLWFRATLMMHALAVEREQPVPQRAASGPTRDQCDDRDRGDRHPLRTITHMRAPPGW